MILVFDFPAENCDVFFSLSTLLILLCSSLLFFATKCEITVYCTVYFVSRIQLRSVEEFRGYSPSGWPACF